MIPHSFSSVFITVSTTALCFALSTEELPPSVPAAIGPNGKHTHDPINFTSKAYEKEAFRLVLREANQVARELKLPEKLPITEKDIIGAYIARYGLSQMDYKGIGRVETRDYAYFVAVDHKLSYVEGNHQAADCFRWSRHYNWPTSRMNTNAAYQMATQWLAAASMDVEGLNRDCQLRVEASRYWNAEKKKGRFVPIYNVVWRHRESQLHNDYDLAASVALFAPTKTLISLRVEDSKYILRKPLVFTNLNILLNTP